MIEWAVEAAKLVVAEAEILQAVQAYKDAVSKAKSAGDALAADWEGDAQVVFVEEQAKAYQWHMSISDIVTAFAETLKGTASKYENVEQTITNIIKSR
ncbi:MAG: WXG100 family type VII secretion target [Oscillospiraceae bacterium]|nr:WXG100 family type VII secretion target [Oscillospiraceae bacterium]